MKFEFLRTVCFNLTKTSGLRPNLGFLLIGLPTRRFLRDKFSHLLLFTVCTKTSSSGHTFQDFFAVLTSTDSGSVSVSSSRISFNKSSSYLGETGSSSMVKLLNCCNSFCTISESNLAFESGFDGFWESQFPKLDFLRYSST